MAKEQFNYVELVDRELKKEQMGMSVQLVALCPCKFVGIFIFACIYVCMSIWKLSRIGGTK